MALYNFPFSLVISQRKVGFIVSRRPGVILRMIPGSFPRNTDRSRVCPLFITHPPELFIAQMVGDVILGIILSGRSGT